jgi:hypothetical protein
MGISLHGGSVEQPGVGSSTRDFERWLKGALEVGLLSLSLSESSVKGTWSEGSLAWRPWRIGRKGSGDTSISIWAPLRDLEGDLSTGDFERWMKGAVGMGCHSLKRLTAEGLEGGLLYWEPWKIC